MKLVRHWSIAKMLQREIRPHRAPGADRAAAGQRRGIDERTLRAIIVFLFLYIGAWAAGARILVDSVAARHPAVRVRRARRLGTALAGAGPGLGFAGPMGSFDPSATSRSSC